MADDASIYILDQVTPKPGRAQEFHKAYMEGYAPRAKARGMKLEFSWITPPMWLENNANTIYFVWSVKSLTDLWRAQMQSRLDMSLPDWWRGTEPMIEYRCRNFLAAVSDIEALTNV
jgi:hypothetical protein